MEEEENGSDVSDDLEEDELVVDFLSLNLPLVAVVTPMAYSWVQSHL